MPAETAQVHLTPYNFALLNPMNDVPGSRLESNKSAMYQAPKEQVGHLRATTALVVPNLVGMFIIFIAINSLLVSMMMVMMMVISTGNWSRPSHISLSQITDRTGENALLPDGSSNTYHTLVIYRTGTSHSIQASRSNPKLG